MIKVNYATLRSDEFRRAISKLINCQDLDEQTAYRVMRLAKELEDGLKKSQVEWAEIVSGKVKVEENGSLAINSDKSDFVWEDGVDKESMRTKISEFAKKEIEIDRIKLDLSRVFPAKLSPAEISYLDSILNLPEEV